MQFRTVFLGIGSVLVLALLLLSDPSEGLLKQLPFGSSTLGLLLNLAISVLYVGFLYLARRGLLDFADTEDLYKKALETPQGAGLYFIGIGLYSVAISIAILAATK